VTGFSADDPALARLCDPRDPRLDALIAPLRPLAHPLPLAAVVQPLLLGRVAGKGLLAEQLDEVGGRGLADWWPGASNAAESSLTCFLSASTSGALC
jgi:hypothetical protein